MQYKYDSPYHTNYDRGYYYIKLIFTLLFNAKAILLSVSMLVLFPRSMRAMVDCGTPERSANSRWISPAFSRALNFLYS